MICTLLKHLMKLKKKNVLKKMSPEKKFYIASYEAQKKILYCV